jgi:hypothetical protein
LDKHLHIISHIIPWPADFGGVQDIFNCITALHRKGVRIHLHCFTKDLSASLGPLEDYCESIHLYKRKTGLLQVSTSIPYIVNSRRSKTLVSRLQEDNYPILVQGIHCTHFLKYISNNNRKIAIRLFNVETNYYDSLAKLEISFFKETYFKTEAKLLRNYEAIIAKKYLMLCISDYDRSFYGAEFKAKNAMFLPAFTGHTESTATIGTGDYLLYHGNLSVNENHSIAKWIIEKIADNVSLPVKIAGKNPNARLQKIAKKKTNVEIIANPTDVEMKILIAEAQIHLLPSYNNTGVKLKLLNALFAGKYCITNPAGVVGSGLEQLVHIANSDAESIQLINELQKKLFTQEDKTDRSEALAQLYNDNKNAAIICGLLL